MAKEKIKVYTYTRVSTAMQIDGYSLDAQKSRMKAFAEFNDYEIAHEYEDAGKSGKSIEGRTQFNQMMEDIKTGKDGVSFVLVFKLSRFGRNAADVLSTLQVMQDFGVNLICVEDGIDSSKDAGKLMISVLSAVAEIERENIRVQTMEGRIQKAREGKWNGGFAPYGYKLVDGKLEINEEEAPAIRTIYEQYVTTDSGANGIAKYLENHGISKVQRQNGKNPLFDARLIRMILKNPVYCGKIAYGRRKTEKVHGTRNEYHLVEQENFLLVDGLHEAIIPEDVWQAAQVKLAAQAKRYEHVNKGKNECTHLLSGIVKCPVCGVGMYGNKCVKRKADGSKYKDFYYYGCKHRSMTRGHKCDYKKQIRKELLDDAVAEVICKLVSNPKFAAMMQEKINMKVDTTAIEQEISNYEKQLRQVYSTKSKLIDEIDSLDPDDRHYSRRKSDLDDRLYGMYDKIEELESLLIAARAKKQAIEAEKLTGDNIYKVLIYFDQLYGKMNDREKRQLIEELISEIQIYPERQPNGQWLKSIKFRLPIIEEDMNISLDNEQQVETVVLLSKGEIDSKKVRVEFSLEDMDMSGFQKGATYEQIKTYVLEHTGLKVSSLYISQVKRKCGLDVGQNYNLSKKEDAKVPQCPPEKEAAIMEALKHFQMLEYLKDTARWSYIVKNAGANDIAVILDQAMADIEEANPSLKGALLQNFYATLGAPKEKTKALIDEVNKISETRFHEEDLIGRVYEYFLQIYAASGTKEDGEFYTPACVVKLIAEMIEPFSGTVYDPCCGSGGMFVQSHKFIERHQGNRTNISVIGQESVPDTWRLCKMNLAIRGISHDLGEKNASTFTDDQHKDRKFDFIMANPPFNLKGWRGEDELLDDPRWDGYVVPRVSNANYAWILHIISKLDVNHGIAGFLLANGALNDPDEYENRKRLLMNDTRLDEEEYDSSSGEYINECTVIMPYSGRLDTLGFLSRLYNLKELPSHDSRYRTAYDDINCHLRWGDYEEECWFFEDERFNLRPGDGDETLLRFMCEMLHPAVRNEKAPWKQYLKKFNDLLRVDGYELYPAQHISGRDVYGAREYVEPDRPLLPENLFSERYKDLIDYGHGQSVDNISNHVDYKAKKHICSIMTDFAEPILYRPNRYDNWTEKTDALNVAVNRLNEFMDIPVINLRGAMFSPCPVSELLANYFTPFIFDVVEFQYDELSAGEKGPFQEAINAAFQKDNLSFRLTDRGLVEQLAQHEVLSPEIIMLSEQIKEPGLKELFDLAVENHMQPNLQAHKDAVEKLWDVLERLKTYYTDIDKKKSIEKIVQSMSNGQDAYESLFNAEFKALTDIGNHFRIRHHETNRVDITDVRYYDYFFNRCLSLIALAIQYLQ